MADMGNIKKEITIPNRIFLKGFHPSTKEVEIEMVFRGYGKVLETKIIRDPMSGNNKGFGFVTFDSQIVAEEVLEKVKTITLNGVEVSVGPAKIRRRPPKLYRTPVPPPPPPPPHHPPPPMAWCHVAPDGLFTYNTFNQQAIQYPLQPPSPGAEGALRHQLPPYEIPPFDCRPFMMPEAMVPEMMTEGNFPTTPPPFVPAPILSPVYSSSSSPPASFNEGQDAHVQYTSCPAANLKGQKYVFLTTTPGKVKRVIVGS